MMVSALKEYYKEVLVPYWKWTKRHWKGVGLLLFLSNSLPVFWMYRFEIKDYLTTKFSKTDTET
jgi:hypothetical protein